jgi:hypothetical protein
MYLAGEVSAMAELTVVRRFHVTPWRTLWDIYREGLKCSKSRGAKHTIWLCDETALLWALNHVADHHDVRFSELLLLLVHIPASFVIYVRPGIWRCVQDIPPNLISYCCPLPLIGPRLVEQLSLNQGVVKGAIYGN